ncbi:MAG: prenyltransferase [Actinomycetes bacterium]|jgi:1,4-dihydroxy-2-naphthoate octaprenyltransferase|nr:prenyltransferase [Actinomycetes bacterium]
MTKTHRKLTPTAVLQLIAPHTWVAAVAPVLTGTALSIGLGDLTPRTFFADLITPLIAVLMLVCACAAQSAVNTLNDYVDFRKGTDTADNCVDETDAAIIYHNLDPKSALGVAIGCLVVALAAGITVVVLCGNLFVLVMGLVGLVAVVGYSCGPTPISYLPLGEVVSGGVMGIIITLATYLALTGHLGWLAAAASLPAFITIALIMQVNNTSDIARDIQAGRRTLPIYLGESRSAAMIAAGNVVALSIELILTLALWRFGAPIIVAAACLSYHNIKLLAAGPYNAQTRPRNMRAIVRQAAIINFLFALAILLGAHFR